jgi:hypothetical protein
MLKQLLAIPVNRQQYVFLNFVSYKIVSVEHTMEALNNPSLIDQSTKSKKCDFYFSHKINDLQSFILAVHPCAAVPLN